MHSSLSFKSYYDMQNSTVNYLQENIETMKEASSAFRDLCQYCILSKTEHCHCIRSNQSHHYNTLISPFLFTLEKTQCNKGSCNAWLYVRDISKIKFVENLLLFTVI